MNNTYPFVLEPLTYVCNALEPYIDAQTINVHFSLYLKTYVDKLNAELEQYPELQHWTLEELIHNYALLPSAAQESIKNNAGGVYNHYLYFDCMTPPQTSKMNNAFSVILKKEFGSVQRFKEMYINTAVKSFGSTYIWLVLNQNAELALVTTRNQDNPLACGLHPLMTLDMWEHAYFLSYLNDKKQYATSWFHLINWDFVYQRYRYIYDCLQKKSKL